MEFYKITHPATNQVVNLYVDSQTDPVPNSVRLSLYSWQDNNDQKWRLDSVDGSTLLRLARDTNKVMNRNSSNNNAHVWAYDGTTATKNDSLVETETIGGNTRIKLVRHGLYLTKNANDSFLSWAGKIQSSRQYFEFEMVSGSSSNPYHTIWPLSTKETFPITSGFRTPDRPNHDGVDMAAPLGTPILAIYGGTVSKVTTQATNPLEGISIRIDHDFGTGKACRYLRSYYLHMQRAAVSPGAIVGKGQVIGHVNNTGDSRGNHLHLGIRYKTSPFATGGDFYEGVDFINPALILP